MGLVKEPYLGWFHIKNFSDSSLHDQEVGVVNIKLHRAKKVANPLVLDIDAIYQILVLTAHYYLEFK